MPGAIPYWGANGVVDYVRNHLFNEELVLLGEDGAPFDVPFRDVAFLVDEPVWINNHIHVLRPAEDVSAAYIVYALNATDWIPHVTGSTRLKLTQDRMMRVSIPAWPLLAQRKIADFLDRETQRIDALMDKKRRLIDLLEEKRTATITQAVTKGLNPTVPMKDSGIPWMESIPKHWDAEELKRWWTVTDCLHRTATYVDDGVLLVGTVQVKPGRLSLTGAKMTTEAEFAELAAGLRLPQRGDIIYSRNASLGSAACVDMDERFTMGQDVCLIRSADQNQLYLSYVLASQIAAYQVDAAVVGATFKRINVGQIKNFLVTRPPLAEQIAIARYLDEQTQLMDRATLPLATQLSLLAEYREALITAAVIGEVDVDTFNSDRRLETATS